MGWTLEESNRPTVLQFSRISLDFPRIVSSVHYQAVIGILKQFENMKWKWQIIILSILPETF